MELADLWRGRLSLRRIRVLIDHLPVDSRTAAALAGHADHPLAGWPLTDLLLGRMTDELATFRWQWESSHLDPKKQRPRTQPESVLPDLASSSTTTQDVQVVSPHRLGAFVNETGGPDGN